MKIALFLDRDGVVNVDRDFVFRREDFEFQAGIFDLARIAHQAGLLLVVVTNQSGIARGYYSESDFSELTRWMCAVFAEKGTPIAKVYHCPFHPDHPTEEFAKFENWRKPKPGMFLEAAANLGINLAGSFMIGDRESDAQAAAAAGIRNIMLIGSHLETVGEPRIFVECSRNLKEAAVWLREKITYA
jgi:D-glycero-D-manno-heptose 1,7-bisphosphate phosphatase